MPTYKYEALDTSGNEVKDSIEATNEEEASAKIKSMGYFVTKLTATATGAAAAKKKKKKTGKSRKTFTIGRAKQKSLVTFTRQFSTLQDAGLPVLRSLRILERQMKPSVLKNSLIDVVDDVESGSSLSEAMGKQPKSFNKLYVNMVKAGEAGGALEVILQRLADFLEKGQSLKSKIIGAMVYPAVVIFVAVAILTFIMVMIIPKFKKIFDEFGLTLSAGGPPKPSSRSSVWMSEYWWTIPLFPISLYLLIKLIHRLTRAGNYGSIERHCGYPSSANWWKKPLWRGQCVPWARSSVTACPFSKPSTSSRKPPTTRYSSGCFSEFLNPSARAIQLPTR